MARPVVPIPVGRGVVRVDVARPIVRTIVHVPTATNGTHHVGINEVGVKKSPSRCALQSRMRKIIAPRIFFCLFLEDNYVFRNFFKRRPLARPGERGGCGPLCRLRGIHPYWTKKRPDPEYQTASEGAANALTERGPQARPSLTDPRRRTARTTGELTR